MNWSDCVCVDVGDVKRMCVKVLGPCSYLLSWSGVCVCVPVQACFQRNVFYQLAACPMS